MRGRSFIAGCAARFGAAACVAAIVASLGCDRDGPPLPPRRAPATHTASESHAEASATAVVAEGLVVVDGEAPRMATLRSELDAFTTLDACVASRASLDPLLDDALEAIGYDGFVRDACRVLDAGKSGDARRCDPIDASSLRRQCVALVAEIAGDPDGCPWEAAGRPERGRAGVCLALASRDARLCASGANTAERATCDATLRADPAPCSRIAVAADQKRCLRSQARWRGALPPPDAGLGARPAEGTVRVEGLDGGAVEASLSDEVARGVVIVERTGGFRVDLGPSPDDGPALPPSTRGAALLTAEVESDGGPLRVVRAELTMVGASGVPTLAVPTLEVKVERLERARGGALAWSLDGTIGEAGGARRVHAHMTTFVRDVVTPREAVGLGAREFGDGGAMR